MPAIKRIAMWGVVSSLVLPVVAAFTLAAFKAVRLARLGYPLGQSAQAAIFISGELIVLGFGVALPVIVVLVAAQSWSPRVEQIRFALPLAIVAALVGVVFYEVWWGSIAAWPAFGWASILLFLPWLVIPSLRRRAAG